MYNREQIANALSDLEASRRLALCAICAERLMPLYDRYWATQGKEHSLFHVAMDRVWDHLFGKSVHVEVEALLAEAKAQVPDEDDLVPGYLYAQDAAIAVTYALETWLRDDVRSVVFCLEQAYNVVENYAANQVVPDGIITEPAESAIQQHAVVQAELARQSKEIDLCRFTEGKNWPSVLSQMKAEAGQTCIVPSV